MIKLNNLTLRFILAATFLLVNCSLFAQSSQNPQSRPAWNNPAIPNTGNPAMVKPSVPAGETLHPHGHTGTQPSDTVINPPGISGSTPAMSSENPSSEGPTSGPIIPY